MPHNKSLKLKLKSFFKAFVCFWILGFSGLLFAENENLIPIGMFHFEQYHYLDRDKRVGLLTEAKKHIENSYAGWGYKKDLELHFDQAIEYEKTQVEENDLSYFFATPNYYRALPDLAKANLDFYDRFRALLARFEDSHLIFETTVPFPYITCDLRLEKIGQKFIFSSESPQLNISKGDQLILIDGEKPDFYLKKVIQYVSASSELAREKLAVEALTFRNFLFPTSVYNQIKFKKAETGEVLEAQVKWKLGTRNSRDDVYFYLESIGYEKEDLLRFEHRQSVVEGQRLFDPTQKAYQTAYSVELTNFAIHHAPTQFREPLLRYGYWTHQQKEFGVLQIFSFSSAHTASGDSFVFVLREALKEFRDKGVPLILDLRNNWGGNSSLAMKAAKLFLQEGEMLSPPGVSFLRSTYVVNLMSNLDVISPNEKNRLQIYGVSIAGFWSRFFEKMGDPRRGTFRAFNSQSSTGEETRYFPVVNGQYLQARLQGRDSPYSGSVAVLTGPLCRSVCEVFVRLLTQKRKVVDESQTGGLAEFDSPVLSIGEPTQGTGLGYIENSKEDRWLKTSWVDTLSFIKLRVPNFLSTLSPKKAESILYGQTSQMCTENKPFVPKIAYSPSIEDIQSNDLEALNFAAEKLLSIVEPEF